jgi:hypothetical protein
MTKKLYHILSIAPTWLLVVLCCGCQSAQDQAANKALSTFVGILSAPGHPQQLIDSTLDLSTLKLGTPVKIYYVGSDDIKALNNSPSVIKYTNRLVYPIYNSHDSLISSEELELSKEGWMARRFGERPEMRAYQQALKSSALSGLSNPSIVRVPSLNMSFIQGQQGGLTKLLLLGPETILMPGGDSVSVVVPYTLPSFIQTLKPIEVKTAGLPM